MAALRHLRHVSRLGRPLTCRAFSTSYALSDLARMQIIGRLAASPEATQTSTGKTVFRYAIGTNSGPRDNRSTSWFNVSCFVQDGEAGEGRSQYLETLEKGTLVYVEAEGQMRTYEGEDGKRHKALSLIQRNLQVLSRPLNRTATEGDNVDEVAAATG